MHNYDARLFKAHRPIMETHLTSRHRLKKLRAYIAKQFCYRLPNRGAVTVLVLFLTQKRTKAVILI